MEEERMRDQLMGGGKGFLCFFPDKSERGEKDEEKGLILQKLKDSEEMFSKIMVERNNLRETTEKAVANLNNILSILSNQSQSEANIRLVGESIAVTIDLLRSY